MSFPGPELTQMGTDMSILVNDWGETCTIKRRLQTFNEAGQISGAFATVGAETVWIQPFNTRRGSQGNVIDQGLVDSSMFEYFASINGLPLQAGDKLAKVGDVYEYDVLSIQNVRTHQYGFLRQVKRS